jgi:CPA2 family monovalent cation:H+ antiporter-2
MPHQMPLIATIVAGLVAAFFAAAIAHRLRIAPIAGYLLAGVVIGPFTPGIVADTGLANQLAEIGVILLMFGVGLHFSLRDLLAVQKIALPGAITQITVATVLGYFVADYMGWPVPAAVVFGIALSTASTVVLLRALQARNIVDTEQGRIAVGWLVVEDIAMVLTIVLMPVVAGILAGSGENGGQRILVAAGITVLKIGGFMALMFIVGRRVIPAALHWAAHSGSRELFRLCVLAIALGVAFGAAYVFDVSFALGAFVAGMILGETPLSRRAAEETLPLRDAFAVLFFVSVGMLFDPAVIVEQPVPLLVTLAIVILGKSIAAFGIVKLFGHSNRTALTISASLAQIGEFSFIIASLGRSLDLIPPEANDLILATAIVSIMLNPAIFSLVSGPIARIREQEVAEAAAVESERERERREHVILVGYGRVGKLVAGGVRDAGRAMVLIEDQKDVAREAERAGLQVVTGNAADARVMEEAGVRDASKLLIAIPEGFEAGGIAKRARSINPELAIIARAHSDAEVDHLEQMGADEVIMGEREIASRMLELAGSLSAG